MYTVRQLSELREQFDHGASIPALLPFKPHPFDSTAELAEVPLGRLTVSVRHVPDDSLELLFLTTEGRKQVHVPGINSPHNAAMYVDEQSFFSTLIQAAAHPLNRTLGGYRPGPAPTVN